MNREIKLRVWNTATKGMFYPNWDELAIRAKLPEMILMQYIGIKDKEEVEIYEGDICSGSYAGSGEPPYINQVIWDTSSAGFTFANSPMWVWEDLCIIGNIYENPELLKN